MTVIDCDPQLKLINLENQSARVKKDHIIFFALKRAGPTLFEYKIGYNEIKAVK